MRKIFIISVVFVSALLLPQLIHSQETATKRSTEKETPGNDARPPGGNFIQNTTVQQPDSNFNISGDGIAGGTLSSSVVNAEMQFDLGRVRILSTPGVANLFIGQRSGLSNTTGTSNTFGGFNAGVLNSTGPNNAFFGANAGSTNTEGDRNSFFGESAGKSNSTGGWNSFFGNGAGRSNMDGGLNSFFGMSSGQLSKGGGNSFFGAFSGAINQPGDFNSFFGNFAAASNVSGNRNTAIGDHADVGGSNLTFATAIGAFAIAPFSNSITLGRPDGEDLVRIPGHLVLGELSAPGLVPLCRNAFLLIGPCAGSVTEVEGVKYDRVSVVLENAIKEQQAQIESQSQLIKSQAAQLDKQKAEIDALKKFVCAQYSSGELCSPK